VIPILEPPGLAELLELAWRNAPPGREAATVNEVLRELVWLLRTLLRDEELDRQEREHKEGTHSAH
jgi:hypothetical protein